MARSAVVFGERSRLISYFFSFYMSSNSSYSCKAIAFSDEIAFQSLRDFYPSVTFERLESNCFVARLSERKLIYLFKFKAVVFIGFSPEEEREEASKLRAALADNTFVFEEDEFSISIAEGPVTVNFNSLSFLEWDGQLVDVLAQVLARSCALSIVELEVNNVVLGSEPMTSRITKRITFWPKHNSVLKHFQEILRIRHRLILQLVLLKEPDVIWDNETFDKVYRRLVENFDFRERIESVERMLELSSDVARLRLETIHNRRSEVLEVIIIVLILFEVVHAF